MDPTPAFTTGLAAHQSDAETFSDLRSADVASPVSEAGNDADGTGEGASAAAPRPARSPLMYEHKSITHDGDWTYEGDSDAEEVYSEANGPRGIQGLPDRIKRFGYRHDRAVAMADFLGQLGDAGRVERKRATKLRRCGAHLTFRHYFTLDQLRLHEAYFCQQAKLCPLCAVRRGAKMLRRYTERVLHVLADRPELRMYLVTFTVKNGPDLGERMNHISRGLGQLTLRRRMHWNNDQAYTEACAAVGSVGSFEIKRGTGSGLWHPHFHDAWMCDTEPDEEALRAEWREITGDSHVVDVTPFHYVQRGDFATADTVARDFSEVFKYALKFSELPLADNWHAAQQLHGRRLVRSFGALFGVKVPEDLADDPLDDEDLPYVTMFYRYHAGRGYQLEHFDGDVPE